MRSIAFVVISCSFVRLPIAALRTPQADVKKEHLKSSDALDMLLLVLGNPRLRVPKIGSVGRRGHVRSSFARTTEARRSVRAQTKPLSHNINILGRATRRSPAPAVKFTRREVSTGIACGCWQCGCGSAHALAAITTPPVDLLSEYDCPRDKFKDAGFAMGMAVGMIDYEMAVAPTKKQLFSRVLDALPQSHDAVVVELGMGSFPNAPFYDVSKVPLDIVGVDPNDSMKAYAMKAAGPLISKGSSVRVVHGVGEALPLPDDSVDVVVSTLTLCSVPSPNRALAEVRRVLRPGGQFLFLEHVRSETDSKLAAEQDRLNPRQVARADGCNLNRRTLETIRAAGFAKLDANYFELKDFSYLNPTVAGIATA